jgi:hypothetical protein
VIFLWICGFIINGTGENIFIVQDTLAADILAVNMTDVTISKKVVIGAGTTRYEMQTLTI